MSLINQWIDMVGYQSNELLLKVIKEESNELLKAIEDYEKTPSWDYVREDLLKEMCDVMFTIMVFTEVNKWNLPDALEEVCESNLSKGSDGKLLRRDDGKIMKGPNYRAPDLSGYV